SGEILNETLEGVHSVGGDTITDSGSGAGAFLNIAEEKNLAATAAGLAEAAISTAGETEAGSVPTGGPTLSMSTQNPEDGVTPVSTSECKLSFTYNEEVLAATAAGEAKVPASTPGEAEASGMPSGELDFSVSTQSLGEEATVVRIVECPEVKVMAGAAPSLLRVWGSCSANPGEPEAGESLTKYSVGSGVCQGIG
ncbi:hypothetical protein P7K49_001439, partial [Saguinus oedipus]